MIDRNEKLWPWSPYDASAPDADRIAWLESRRESYEHEAWFHDRWMDALAQSVHEISRSIPLEPPARAGRPATVATFWRWKLWQDCMADVPEQVDMCLNALVGAAFDAARSGK